MAATPPPRRRWLRWLLIALVVVAVAVASVLVVVTRRVRPELERSLSEALRMPARIGSFNIEPWLGSVSLGALTIGSESDVLGAARIAISPQLGTVWQKDIVIDRVEVGGLHGVLHLDENYQPVFRTVVTGERAATPGTYHVTIRELVVDDGELTVRYPVRGKPRDGKLQITGFRATNIELGRIGGSALDMSGVFEGAFDGARIEATTDVRLGDANPSVAFDFAMSGLRVSRDMVTLPPALDTLTGTIYLRAKLGEGGTAEQQGLLFDVGVADAALKGTNGSALAAKRIALPAVRINVAEQAIDLGALNIDAPSLTIRLTDQGVVLPFTTAERASDNEWKVVSGPITTRDGTLQVLREDTTTSLMLKSLRWDGLRAKGESGFELAATIEDGTISADGKVDPQAQAMSFEARLDNLPLPTLAQLAGRLPLTPARGRASGEMKVQYQESAQQFSGRLALQDLHTAPPSPERPSEVLAVSNAEAVFSMRGAADPVLTIDSLTLSYPYIMIQRHADTLFPYSLLIAPPTSTARASTYRTPTVRVERVGIDGGKIEFIDTTVQPLFWSAFTDLTFAATKLRHPEMTIADFTFKGKHDELSPTVVTGSLRDEGLKAHAELKDILLETLNAYVSPALGYRFAAGRLSSTATTTPAPPLLQSTADIVLRGIDLIQTGRDVVQEQSGVPLPVALSLISNLSGEVRLTIPLAIDTEFQQVSFGSVFWQAVRQAILNALTSPIRLLGSLFGKKGAPHAFAIDPIPFAEGSARPDRTGRNRIDQITRILTAHPGLTLVLLPQVTEKEMRDAGPGASALAEARNAAVRDAFLGSADPLPPDRVILAPWKPETAAKATGQPGVYVELQDAS